MQTMTFDDRRDIAQHYLDHMEEIVAAGNGWGLEKYRIPHLDKMTPIEVIAFDECIGSGLAMYPEWPVGRYFVDLGNPRLKVALELDGLEFHQDWVADSKRDAELWERYGWKVFRCSGSRCNVRMRMPSEDDLDQMRHWLHVTVDGLVYALATVYVWGIDQDNVSRLQELCITELSHSRVIDDFPICNDPIVRLRQEINEPVHVSVLMAEIMSRFLKP